MIDEFDSVLKPRHYCDDKIESLVYIRQQLGKKGYMAYCVGNMHKYLHRHEKKENNIINLSLTSYY